MARSEITPTQIPDILLIQPVSLADNRGSFAETYNKRTFGEFGIAWDFVQDNQSISARRGTIRGLHFQAPPVAQTKLVRVLRGSVLDVAVDLRHGSPSFGKHVSQLLSEANQAQLLIPEGFAHGFCTLEDDVVVLYKVSDFYSPQHERGIRWDDPVLGIDWGITADRALLSARDQRHPRFGELPVYFEYKARAKLRELDEPSLPRIGLSPASGAAYIKGKSRD